MGPTMEFDYIRWIRKQTPASPGVVIGPGDDCALVECPGNLLVTTDMLMEGIDFVLPEAGILRVGHKAMAVNLSDIAAMGGRARWAVVSVALPRSWTTAMAEELYRGMRERADRFDTAIVG